MATEDKSKRVVQIEIDDQVKKLTIEGIDKDAQVVMREELSNEELDSVAGGYSHGLASQRVLENCSSFAIIRP